MNSQKRRQPFGTLLALLVPVPCFAAHPLITDDTSTQGQGHLQIELTLDDGRDKTSDVKSRSTDLASTLTYGLNDAVDVALVLPYSFTRTSEMGTKTTASGFGDVELDAKWRFYQQANLSFAFKSGIALPTGNDRLGLGVGKTNGNVHALLSYEAASWAFHFDVGYQQNRNVLGERESIRQISGALTWAPVDKWMLIAEVGEFTADDLTIDDPIHFATIGAIYSVRENVDLDVGFRRGISSPENDATVLAGVTLRF